MTLELSSNAERAAEAAEGLRAFSGFKLSKARADLTEMLKLIGSDGVFREYTTHDISHIDAMLEMVDWVIPAETQEAMTPADWLLLVLAIYFHDLGMLVTRDEFDGREEDAAFVAFRSRLQSDDSSTGLDYRSKIEGLEEGRRDEFLYQEYIRKHHAARIRAWITGPSAAAAGPPTAAAAILDRLLDDLNRTFRADLGLVCESHHLSDLDNIERYPLSQPYGNSSSETANVQYAAVVLRTVDLLHITSDRTPRVMFQLINPRDPISQGEWAKQEAVRTVRPKKTVDEEGRVSAEAPSHTIEVYADFTDEIGFFGLTSYLNYAESELTASHKWVSGSEALGAERYTFPWRKIDQSNVNAVGFVAKPFEFVLDQARILDLLTGHMLYNDSSVVVRELVQNALDAVKLRRIERPEAGPGSITVRWDSRQRTLEVSDDGVGMTQQVIADHFLTVGSSRYRDPRFIRQHPEFSAISRFGIGVLSTFMIADEVEVETFALGEEEGRHMSLRDVHGRYLVRYLDRSADSIPSGTTIRLRLRPSVKLGDIERICRRWFVTPSITVQLVIDDDEPIAIGHPSPAAALEQMLRVQGTEAAALTETRQLTVGGLTVAYAVRYNRYFDDWTFIDDGGTPDDDRRNRSQICVEGINVDRLNSYGVLTLVNAVGRDAPKTNVARSGIDEEDQSQVDDAVLQALRHHLDTERDRHLGAGRSKSWFANELTYLLQPLLNPSRANRRAERLVGRFLDTFPMYLVERDGDRDLVSMEDLDALSGYWTVDSQFFDHASWLIQEAPSEVGFAGLARVIPGAGDLPAGPILCPTATSRLRPPLWRAWPTTIIAQPDQRRLDVEWCRTSEESWTSLGAGYRRDDFYSIVNRSPIGQYLSFARDLGEVYCRRPPRTEGLEGYGSVAIGAVLSLLPGTSINDFMVASAEDPDLFLSSEFLVASDLVAKFAAPRRKRRGGLAADLRRQGRQLHELSPPDICRQVQATAGAAARLDWATLADLLAGEPMRCYDTSVWSRTQGPDDLWLV